MEPSPVIQPVTSPSDNYEQANKLFQTGVILIYGKRKSIDKAIKCIQRAITLNDSDYKYWQILGEAYYQRGSLNPSINCFMKSLKLVEDANKNDDHVDEARKKREFADCIYSRLRMSDIRLSVGHLDEALKGYTDIIESDPNNLAAVVGLAKTQLQLTQTNFLSGLVKMGHLLCIEALKNALKAIKLCPHLCLTWKLASDCCLVQFVHGHRGNFVAKINEDFPGCDQDNTLVIDRLSCIKLAKQFLCKALDNELFQDSGCLWHNLGITLYLQSTICSKQAEREILLKRSMKCLLKALDYDRDSSQIKNSIGVVAFNLNLLNFGQSYIIKSIQTNMSTSEIQFSNLGYMYLQKGEYRLASVAFSRCQAEEPLYARSWLGNALINEQNNVDNMSNLRNCHKLDCNFDSQLMFAIKVACLSNDEKHRADLISALDCMKRVINYDENSLEANNTLGLLYEKVNNLELSKRYFEKANSIKQDDPRTINNRLRRCKVAQSCFMIDDNSNDDLNFIKTTTEKHIGNRESTLNFLFYLFNNGDYKNVFPKLIKYIDKLPDDDHVKTRVNTQILLALAARGDKSDFKNWLFKNVIDLDGVISIESNINMLLLMLFGASENDTQILNETLKTLPLHLVGYISNQSKEFSTIFYSQDGFWLRYGIFCSIFCFKDQGKLIRIITALFPTVPELWLYLGMAHILQSKHQQTALYCIKKASQLGSTCGDLIVICDLLMAILAQNKKLKLSAKETRVNHLSRALFRYPNYGILWKLLSATVKDSEKSNKCQQQASSLFDGENSSLFYLALDLTIKMIRT